MRPARKRQQPQTPRGISGWRGLESAAGRQQYACCKRAGDSKAEWLAGARGGDPRFVVTSLDRQTIAKQALYEELYCARGDMENRIKEQQLWLFADRTSAATMRANQGRLYFSAFAGILLTILRRAGLKGTVLANARFDTIRSRLIKLAGRITVSVRRADRGKEENRGSKALSRSLPRSIRRSVLAVIRPPCRAMWPFMVPYSPANLWNANVRSRLSVSVFEPME